MIALSRSTLLDLLLCLACPGRAVVAYPDGSMLLVPLTSDFTTIEVVHEPIDE